MYILMYSTEFYRCITDRNIAGGNFLGGNFPGENSPGRILMDGNFPCLHFPSGSFPDTVSEMQKRQFFFSFRKIIKISKHHQTFLLNILDKYHSISKSYIKKLYQKVIHQIVAANALAYSRTVTLYVKLATFFLARTIENQAN